MKNLNAEITDFLAEAPLPYSVSKDFQNNDREYVFIAKRAREIPDRFSVLAGEIVHNLASALDHLFAALVTRKGNAVEKRHFFPIYTEAREFRKACKKGLLNDISPTAQEIIRSIQPCFASAMPRDTILAAVRELNGTDKHRLLVVLTGAATVGSHIRIGTPGKDVRDVDGNIPGIVGLGSMKPVEITESGVVFFSIRLATPTPQFEADAQLIPKIAFAKCGLAKMVPVIDVLAGMVAGVTQTINLFAGEFDAND